MILSVAPHVAFHHINALHLQEYLDVCNIITNILDFACMHKRDIDRIGLSSFLPSGKAITLIIVSCTYRSKPQTQDSQGGLYSMGDEEKEPMIHEEDEHGNILIYPNWSKKNAPKEQQNKWEVPIYM